MTKGFAYQKCTLTYLETGWDISLYSTLVHPRETSFNMNGE